MKSYPTHWQRKVIWAALTYLCIVAIGSFSIALVVLIAKSLNFLQPLLAPVALAAVLAYLLDPLVARIMKFGTSRIFAVSLVFATFILAVVLIFVWIVPVISAESMKFARDVPEYADKAEEWLFTTMSRFQESRYFGPVIRNATDWIESQVPLIASNVWLFIQTSAGGFLGIFGILFGLVLVPIILFYFLKDGPTISDRWTDYLPLRASHFKDEVVDVLTEINNYLIAFFRGQLLVSIADGILTGIALLIMGLDFALFIGLLICVLALIPYIGITLCWIPAVLIAALQWNDWIHPIVVTIIFIVVQQFEGWFISPKIVGNSVGLHPLTVIVAVFGWSLLIGGLLGAILAVPLTATIKVLLYRYVWRRQFVAATNARASLEEPSPNPLSPNV
jgi:predicted PurR-regulated permease PerM